MIILVDTVYFYKTNIFIGDFQIRYFSRFGNSLASFDSTICQISSDPSKKDYNTWFHDTVSLGFF